MTQSVRVAIVSDTHGELDRRIAELIRTCDYVVHAGDIGSRAVDGLMRPKTGVKVVVRGNNDVPAKCPSGEHAFLASLPVEADLELPGGCLCVVHGDRAGGVRGRHERLRRQYPHARVVVYGHSHRLNIDKQTHPWVLNPGASGIARTFGGPSLIVLSAGDRRWRVRPVRFELPGQRSL